MSSLSDSLSHSQVPRTTLLIRISLVRSQGRRHNTYVTIERRPEDDDAAVFV